MSNRGHIGMATQSPGGRRDLFLEQGYLVLSGVLDPGRDLAPLARAYSELTYQLMRRVLGDAFPSAVPGYEAMDFPNRFASLVGITRGLCLITLLPR